MDDSGVVKLLSRNDIRVIASLAANLGVEAFLVGGCLRDLLLDRESNDLDFALSGAYEELPRAFADRISGSFFWLDEERRQARVVKKRSGETELFDFAPLCGSTIDADLAARDFTINAMAVQLTGGSTDLIDPIKGREDLRLGVIRVCGESSFDTDPLRLMRAIRFSAELEFAIEEATWSSLCRKAHLLKGMATERVRDELFRTLAAPGCGASLKRLCDSGLWGVIHPGQTPESMDSGIGRAMAAERICADAQALFPEVRQRLADYLGREVEGGISVLSLIRLAAFLGSGEGATAPLAERLRLGRDATRMLTYLSRDERPLFAYLETAARRRPIFRFFRDREPAGPGMLINARADGAISDLLFSRLMGYFLREYDPEEGDLFLSGREVMEILDIPPGRAVGRAMERLREVEAGGIVSSREEARQFIKNLLTKEESIG
jgi:poly(A) polymerase